MEQKELLSTEKARVLQRLKEEWDKLSAARAQAAAEKQDMETTGGSETLSILVARKVVGTFG